MNRSVGDDPDDRPLDAEFVDQLVAYDAQLAAGDTRAPSTGGAAGTSSEALARLNRAKNCVLLLECVWPRATARDAVDLACPTTIGRFRIARELGRGGFGIVYLARDERLGREIALKVQRPETIISPSLRERFLREAKAAARLEHPGIAGVHEVGEEGFQIWIASEYVPGGSLAAWQRSCSSPLPPRDVATFLVSLAEAIEYAHRQGVLHRDLKPNNVLVQTVGGESTSQPLSSLTPKVIDFGLARIDETPGQQTRTGALIGTPPYMAPEQATGRVREIGAATDVYGLGTILYELLTGQPAFQGQNDVQTLRHVVEDDPVRPGRLRAGLPADLEAICLKCLEKKPDARYASCAALADDLRRFLAGEPTCARPAGPIERLFKWSTRRPAMAALAVVSIAASVALVVAAVWHSVRVTQLYEVAESRRLEAEARQAEVEQKQEALRNYLYVADIPLAYQAYQRHDLAQMKTLLARHVPRAGETDLRGFPWYFLEQLRRDEQPALKGHAGDVFTVLYSPDGKLLASCGKDQTVRLWNASDRRLMDTLRGHTKEVNIIAFSRDGSLLASGGEDGVVNVWDVASAISTAPSDTSSPSRPSPKYQYNLTLPVATVAFSPDGRTLAAAGTNHAIELFPLEPNGLRRTMPTTGQVSAVLFSHNGESIYFAAGNKIRLWECTSGHEQAVSAEGPHDIGPLAMSHDGKLLVSADLLCRVRLWSSETLASRSDWILQDSRIDALEFAPDDRTLALGGKGRTVSLLDIATLTTRSTLLGHAAWVWSAAFSPDGNTLATSSADGMVKLWDLNHLGPHRLACDPNGTFRSVAFSPDSQTLAVGKAKGWIELWDWQSGRRLNVTRVDQPIMDEQGPQAMAADVMALAFSPNGRQLASSHPNGQVRLWDTSTLAVTAILSSPTSGKLALAYSPDGRTLAVGGHPRESCARFWDLQELKPRPVNVHLLGVDNLCYLDAVPWVAAYSHDFGHLQLLRSTDYSRQAYLGFPTEQNHSIAVSADGRLTATGGTSFDPGLFLWNTATGRCLARLSGHQAGISEVSFCPDGRTIASASADGTLRLWDLWSCQELLSLGFGTAIPESCRVSPDGRAIALAATSADGQGQLFVWSAGVPTVADHAVSLPILQRQEEPIAPDRTQARAAETADGGFVRRTTEGRWFRQQCAWANSLAERHGGETSLPTFEERMRGGALEQGAVVLRKGMGATMWTGVFPPLDPWGEDNIRANLRFINGRTDLPNQAVAGCVLGKAFKSFPASWTMILLPESAVERQSVGAADIGPTDDLFERFRHVHRWAKQHGFTGGFPTFIDEEKNGHTYYGVVLIKPDMGEEVWH